MVKSYEAIGKYIEKQNKDGAIVIVGGERLASCCAEKAISALKFEEKYSNLHLQEDEDWVEFSKSIDKLYEKYQSNISGLVFICNVNNTIADRINRELELSNNMGTGSSRRRKNSHIEILHVDISERDRRPAANYPV